MKKILPLVLSMFIFGCSTRPKLLPNDQLLSAGKTQSEKDVNECLALADTYAKDSAKWKDVAGNTAKAGVLGAAGGAVGGAIVHNAGKGVAVGSASAAVVSLLNDLISSGESDPTYKNFADYCLRKKGYEVAGWQ
jgi:hypothetical protein